MVKVRRDHIYLLSYPTTYLDFSGVVVCLFEIRSAYVTLALLGTCTDLPVSASLSPGITGFSAKLVAHS